MKQYKIVVNGVAYEVQVEEVGGTASAPAMVAPTPVAAPVASAPVAAAPAPKAAPAPAPQATAAGATTIEAPMPGTILDVKVKAGDSVSEGQVLLMLEAMKMENEIMASRAGIVDVVQVVKGASVNTGDMLLSLK